MSGFAFPEGRCTLRVTHHGISQPSPASWRLASSSQDLSGPCYSHQRVVHDAEAQRLMEYLYTPRYCYISPLCFTAQRRLEGHDPVIHTCCPGRDNRACTARSSIGESFQTFITRRGDEREALRPCGGEPAHTEVRKQTMMSLAVGHRVA